MAPLQPTGVKRASNVWVVKTTPAALGGDLCFIKGCAANPIEVQVGQSYAERGMRNDSHDALGLVLRLPVVSKDTSAGDTRTPASVSEPGEETSAEVKDNSELVAKIFQWMEQAEVLYKRSKFTSDFLDQIEPLLQSLENTSDAEDAVVKGGITKSALPVDAR